MSLWFFGLSEIGTVFLDFQGVYSLFFLLIFQDGRVDDRVCWDHNFVRRIASLVLGFVELITRYFGLFALNVGTGLMLPSAFELLKFHLHIEAVVLLSSQLHIYFLHGFAIRHSLSLKLLNFTNKILNFVFSPSHLLFELTIEFD